MQRTSGGRGRRLSAPGSWSRPVLACLGVDIPPMHYMPANIPNPEQVAEVVAKISGYDRVTT